MLLDRRPRLQCAGAPRGPTLVACYRGRVQRLLASLACVAAVACGSGCGCSGGDSTPTAERPATRSQGAEERALERYLAAVAPVARDLARARSEAAAALDAFDPTDPGTWSDAGSRISAAGDRLERAAQRLSAVPPPAVLRGAQARLERSLAGLRRTAREAMDAAEGGDLGGVVDAAGRAQPQLEAVAAQLRAFASQVGRRARELGVALPDVLRELQRP
jgi:hypothetical protein